MGLRTIEHPAQRLANRHERSGHSEASVTQNHLVSTFYLLDFERAVEHVAMQTGRSPDDASDRMIERAHVEQCTLGDLALAVVEGRVRFG